MEIEAQAQKFGVPERQEKKGDFEETTLPDLQKT